MPECTQIAKVLLLLGLKVNSCSMGVGAYYSPGLMQRVCEHRVAMGWNDLDCSHNCLVSAIEPEHIGEEWLVYHPTLSYHL